jgi:hypothetical protein
VNYLVDVRRVAAALCCAALIVAGCSSTDDPVSSGAPSSVGSQGSAASEQADPTDPTGSVAPTTAAPLTDSFRGVTAEAIEVGFVMIDFQQLRDLGLIDIRRGDPQVIADALIGDLNARGGILGRSVEATVIKVSPVDNTAAERACRVLTEDLEVFAVLGGFVGPTESLQPCFYTDHDTILIGGVQTKERLESANAPWLAPQMSAARRVRGTLELMKQEGLLDGKVGLVVGAQEEAVFGDLLDTTLAELDVEVLRLTQEDVQGDELAGASQWEVFNERFRVDEVNTVLLTNGTGNFGAEQLVSADFEGQILFVDTNDLVHTLGDSELGKNAFGGVIGPMTILPDESFELPEVRECLNIVEEANPGLTVRPSSEIADGDDDWFTEIVGMCRWLRVFEDLATEAGPDLTNDTFGEAIATIEDFTLVGVVDASIAPNKTDLRDDLRLGRFDPDRGANGGGEPITDWYVP